MFERYTEKARRTIFFARYEASKFGSTCIEPEHILLGLLNDSFLTGHVLQGVSVQSIREEVLSHLPRAKEIPTSADLPLSNDAKLALSHGAKEAERLADRRIRNQHLLLGLMQLEDCYATQLLKQRGVVLGSLRHRVAETPHEEEITVERGASGVLVAKSPGIPAGYIPTGYPSPRLIYNPASEMLVLELRAVGQQFLPTRLFMRHKDSKAYEQIGDPAEDVSYESPVTCDKQPLVVFNSNRWPKEHHGGGWEAIFGFNLRAKAITVTVSRDTLRFPDPFARVSIASLISLSDDANNVYVNARTIGKASGSGGGMANYLAVVDLRSHKLEVIAPLQDAFF